MRSLARRLWQDHLFALLVGGLDGMLTAITFAAAKIGIIADGIGLMLALRLGAAAALTGAFVFFVAEYARLRGELVHAERQLNLASHGHLATTRLGEAVLHDALKGAMVSGACGFLGALIPLVAGMVFRGPPWTAFLVAIVILGLLGVLLASVVSGNRAQWAISLMGAGVVLAIVGVKLHVI
jgi:predicted membrane protein (TIGR00267 family)